MSTDSFPQTLQDRTETALNKGNELLSTVEHAFDQTRELAGKSMDAAAQASARAQRQLSHYADATSRHVAEQPLRSVLIAAALGALVASLVMATRRSR